MNYAFAINAKLSFDEFCRLLVMYRVEMSLVLGS